MFETCFAGVARSIFAIPPLELLPAPSEYAYCSTVRAAFLTGGLVGILGLASLFNLILLAANPRNISHLIFSCISGLAAFAVLLPHETGEAYSRSKWIALQIFWIWLPVLLFWFVYVLFPALGRSRGRLDQKEFLFLTSDEGYLLRLYGLAVRGGRLVTTPAAIGLSAGYFWWGLQSNAPPPLWLTEAAVAYLIATGLFTGMVLVTACYYRQQGAVVALVGYLSFVAGVVFEAVGSGPDAPQIRPQIAGVLGFVLSMVVLMGPYRYQMHRQLRRSRNVLHESNQKLRQLDVVKNRYIAGSAREMQIPLEHMLERCMNIVEDPAYRLGHTQLQALSGVMDMARKMIRRNERAAALFQEREIHATHFDALDFFEMLVVMLEEQLHPLRFRFDASACLPAKIAEVSAASQAIEILADRVLIETAFRELAENAAGHGSSEAILLRIVPDAGQPDRIELQFIESNLSRSALQLYALSAEFQTGHEEDAQPAGPGIGIGLGLSLVRRIAESHGSQLQITALPEQPATVVFSFSVPRSGVPLRPPEVEWGLKHLHFLLQENYTDQAADEARVLARRFPAYREQLRQIFEDSP